MRVRVRVRALSLSLTLTVTPAPHRGAVEAVRVGGAREQQPARGEGQLRGGEAEREGARLGEQVDHAEDEGAHLGVGWG